MRQELDVEINKIFIHRIINYSSVIFFINTLKLRMKKTLIIVFLLPIIVFSQENRTNFGLISNVNYGKLYSVYHTNNGLKAENENIILIQETFQWYFFKNSSLNIGIIHGQKSNGSVLENFRAVHQFINLGLGYNLKKNKFGLNININSSRSNFFSTYTYKASDSYITNVFGNSRHYSVIFEIIPKYYINNNFYIGTNFNYIYGYGYSFGFTIGANI